MTLVRSFADELLEQHPAQAAGVLERLGSAETRVLLERSGAARGGALLRRLSPPAAHAALEALAPATSGAMLDTLPIPTAAILLRSLDEQQRAAILEAMDRERVRGIAALLHHAPGSAGALMDPFSLALPQDATAGEALTLVREHAVHARYNLYVVDRERRLVGVLNLRELLLADPGLPLSEIMVREPRSIRSSADRSRVLGHPGWREAHALPVVDDGGVYLGAIRYRTLRRLEDERQARGAKDDDASVALGALFAAGAGGLLDAIAGPPQNPGGIADERR